VLPFPSPGNLPNPGIKPRSPALQEDSLPAEQEKIIVFSISIVTTDKESLVDQTLTRPHAAFFWWASTLVEGPMYSLSTQVTCPSLQTTTSIHTLVDKT